PWVRPQAAYYQRARGAAVRHREAEEQVQRADVLVVGREEPPVDEALLVAVVVVGLGAVCGCGIRGHVLPTSGVLVCYSVVLLRRACDRSACRRGDALRIQRGGGRRGIGFLARRGSLCRRGGGRRGDGSRRGGVGGLLRSQPLAELGLRHGPDNDRHEAVVLAAQHGALAAVDARLLDVGPGLV